MRSSKSDYSLCGFLSMTPYVGIYPWVSPVNSDACSKLSMVLCEREEGSPIPLLPAFQCPVLAKYGRDVLMHSCKWNFWLWGAEGKGWASGRDSSQADSTVQPQYQEPWKGQEAWTHCIVTMAAEQQLTGLLNSGTGKGQPTSIK